ncbi:MAG: hypothetical protein ACYCO9_16390 [Streptosporangiaceae bacterium]
MARKIDAGEAAEVLPRQVWKGRVAVYETPDGGAVAAVRADGEAEDKHMPIPAAGWQIMAAILRGEQPDMNPVRLMTLLMGR